jgi:predicted solute-binding protein
MKGKQELKHTAGTAARAVASSHSSSEPSLAMADVGNFWSAKYLFLFVFMVVVAVTWNKFYYAGIQKNYHFTNC